MPAGIFVLERLMRGILPENLSLYETRAVLTIDEIMDWEAGTEDQVEEDMICIFLSLPDMNGLFDLMIEQILSLFRPFTTTD